MTLDLAGRLTELENLVRERDEQIAFLGALLAEREPPPAIVPPPPVAKAAPAPAMTAYDRVDAELSGLAIIASEGKHPADRRFWLSAIEQLGRHLQPDASRAGQVSAAIRDPRGEAFVVARQRCAT